MLVSKLRVLSIKYRIPIFPLIVLQLEQKPASSLMKIFFIKMLSPLSRLKIGSYSCKMDIFLMKPFDYALNYQETLI